MKFLLQVGFPIGLLIVPMFLVGQPRTILIIGFLAGVAMSMLALGSGGFEKSLGGGLKTARFYLFFAIGLTVLAVGATLFVASEVPAISRPTVQAQLSMLPPVLWGSVFGFVLAAALSSLRRRQA